MTAYVYLALRDGRPIGAGGRLEDAERLCEAKAAEMREPMGLEWRPPETAAGRAGDPQRGELVEQRGLYAIRRVPVARFAGGEGGE